MITKQCSFVDEDGTVCGGILCDFVGVDEAFIICGCCGGIVDPKEVTIVKVYDDWVDLSKEIIGD